MSRILLLVKSGDLLNTCSNSSQETNSTHAPFKIKRLTQNTLLLKSEKLLNTSSLKLRDLVNTTLNMSDLLIKI